ncbi:MAG: DUF4241 domain-containing protein [Microscillaceae bacterium]|nr:DUF4241 domain-containing protein [Microscillaceae bacterium]
MIEHPAIIDYSLYLESKLEEHNLISVKIGHLYLPTGKIVAADPFFSFGKAAFNRRVKPGFYPVMLYLTEGKEDAHRIALAKIQFNNNPILRWVMAISEGMEDDEVLLLSEDEFLGYPVDAGLGMFVDELINYKFNLEMELYYQKHEYGSYYKNVLAPEFLDFSGKNPLSRKPGDWNIHYLKGNRTDNVVMFATGMGDGVYPCYWALDHNDQEVALITDFLMLSEV